MTTAIMTTTTPGTTTVLIPRQQRRRLRPGKPVPPPWLCENCDEHNEGRRRRCHDCGTTRL